MDQVFSIPELVEPILEYAMSGEPWETQLRLRTVCKLWRLCSLKGLVRSGFGPLDRLVHSTPEEGEERLNSWKCPVFPGPCPVPLSVSICGGDVTVDLFRYLASHPLTVTSIVMARQKTRHVPGCPTRGLFDVSICESLALSPERLPVELPHLRKICYRLDKSRKCDDTPSAQDVERFNRIKAVADKLVEVGGKIDIYSVKLGSISCTSFLPSHQLIFDLELSKHITRLSLSTTASTMSAFLEPSMLPNLKDLILNIDGCERYSPHGVELMKINDLLKSFGRQLRRLTLDGHFNYIWQGLLILPTMLQLEKLYIQHVPIDPGNGLPPRIISDRIPVLVELHLNLGHLSALMRIGVRFEHVLKLKLTDFETLKQELYQSTKEQLLSAFAACPKIVSFEWTFKGDLVNSVQRKVLLHLFEHSMSRIKRLSVGFFSANPVPQDQHRMNLALLLTDLTNSDIPRDRSVWATALTNRAKSISNLPCLETLAVQFGQDPACVADEFIFEVAFLPMRALKRLEFYNVDVHPVTVQAWETTGRTIHIDNRRFNSSEVLREISRNQGRIFLR